LNRLQPKHPLSEYGPKPPLAALAVVERDLEDGPHSQHGGDSDLDEHDGRSLPSGPPYSSTTWSAPVDEEITMDKISSELEIKSNLDDEHQSSSHQSDYEEEVEEPILPDSTNIGSDYEH
jgi:hypothetical protein